jgi:helicase
MDLSTSTNVLSSETFKNVLATSPFADRAERIRSTLRAVHHQYLEQKLTGQYIGPEVDYASLEEVAYYLSGIATTPRQAGSIPLSLKSQMLAISALVFEYLGDIASSQAETNPNLEASHLYYLDACICNTLGLFEANTIALAQKHLLRQDALNSALNNPDILVGRDVCQNILYAWLAREMPFLWVRRRRIDLVIKNTIANLNTKLADGSVSQSIYGEMRYWLALAEGVTLHARFFQFGKDHYLRSANEEFSYAIEQARQLNNPPLLWIAYAVQKCAESMDANSVWKRLIGVCPSRYLRRLVTSSPPVLELWASQISALEATALHPVTGEPIALDHGFLDSGVHRLVIGMPTSAGKTLLAELAIIRTLFPDAGSQKPVPNTTCIYVVPSLALVNQIEAKLLTRLLPMGIRVTAILGGYDVAQLDDMLLTQTRVAVVTPEKLDMLVRQDHTFVQNCGLFVFDEIHKVDNLGRGWTMEAIITWLKDFHPQAKQAKMIFMSAVMPNFLQIQMWVQDQDAPEGRVPAVSISESWQPTRQIKGFLEIDHNDIIEKIEKLPLTEYWYGAHLNYVSDRSDLAQPLQIRRLIRTKETFRRSIRRKTKEAYTKRESKSSFGVEENAAEIAKRYIKADLDPVLVFFISRDQTRSFCGYLASSEDYSPVSLTGREQTQYGLFLNYLEDRLGDKHPLTEFAAKGIAYHHGWLPRDVRAEIEYAFSHRWIRVLASTTTLIEGVNFRHGSS